MPRFLVEEELRSGALVIPIDRPVTGKEGYYLVYPEEKANLPTVIAFFAAQRHLIAGWTAGAVK